MTTQERAMVVSTITEKIREDGFLKLSKLRGVFLEAHIDPSLYANMGPKKWITEFFPEFYIDGDNGKETIMLNSPVVQIQRVINEALAAEGKILMSTLPALIDKKVHINYKNISNGQKLGEWISSTFSGFTVSEDNLWLTKSTGPQPKPSVVQKVSEAEITQMHAIAFMDWWSKNLKKLHTYNNDLNSEIIVKSEIARQFSRIMLGNIGLLIFDRETDENRIAFDTGLISLTGRPIYGILILNPKNIDGEKQAWSLEDFACDDEDTSLGRWLKARISLRERKKESFYSLEKKAKDLKTDYELLIPVLKKYLGLLEEGLIPEKVSDKLAHTEELAAELKRTYENVWNQEYPRGLAITEVLNRVEGKNLVIERLRESVHSFDEIADQTQKMFEHNNLPVVGRPTTEKDKEQLHRLYDDPQLEIDFTAYENILESYRALYDVMSAEAISDSVGARIEVFCKHFTEIAYRVAARLLIGSEECEYSYLQKIEELRTQLIEFKKLLSNITSDEKEVILTPAQLLEKCTHMRKDGIALAELASKIIPDDEKIRMLILHPEKELDTDCDVSDELTYFGAAQRLYSTIGNEGQLAEKYFILGLMFDEERCVYALLKLYREENNKEMFQRLTSLFIADHPLTFEDQVFYLSILKQKDPEAAIRYAKGNFYLFYLKDSIRELLHLPENILTPSLAAALMERLEQYEGCNDPNPLEKAVIEENIEEIQSILEDRNSLEQWGYSEEEIERISARATIDKINQTKGNDDYKTGIRLYYFQKNKNGLAEKYMWKGVAQSHTLSGANLMVLMADQNRWEEICSLYECYQKDCSAIVSCRQLYLIAYVHQNPTRAKEYICANLQDCLEQAKTQSLVKIAIQETLDNCNREDANFYADFIKLEELLSDPVVSSVVLMDRTLREYTVSDGMSAQGVPATYAERMSNAYQIGDYSKGDDALSISKRAFSFFAAYKGVSEAFAKFALPDSQAVEQMWIIYNEMGDEALLFGLLQNYSFLKEEHKGFYYDLLFRREAYQTYVKEYIPDKTDPGNMLRYFIAQLKLDPRSSVSLPPCKEWGRGKEGQIWFSEWGGLLVETLMLSQRISDVEAILENNFSAWVESFLEERYTENTIHSLVTGNDTADRETLQEIRKSAFGNGQIQLAVYISGGLEVPGYEEEAKQYLEQMMKESERASDEDRLKILNQLSLLFGKVSDSVNAQKQLLKIRRIQGAADSANAAETIGELIKNYPVTDETLPELLEVLCDPAMCLCPAVYRSLGELAETTACKKEVILYFHGNLQFAREADQLDFFRYVCHFYIRAFSAGDFPSEILDETVAFCEDYVKKSGAAEGVLCLYFAEKSLGKNDYSDYLLRVLADLPSNRFDDEMGKILSGQLQKTWKTSLPGYFELFKNCLINSSIEEIYQYIKFAHISSKMEFMETLQFPELKDQMLSENDSNLVLMYLYLNPGDQQAWEQCTHLPIQDSPVAYAKLLFMACRKKIDLWEKCADYCEKYEQYDLLLDVLCTWTGEKDEEKAEKSRKYLEDNLMSHPEYFARWKDRPELVGISRNVCDRVKQSDIEYHATLRAVSLICEKTGSTEAVDYLLDMFGASLFGKCCNLCVALAANLILDGYYAQARSVLASLSSAVVADMMNYSDLVKELANLTEDEIASWIDNAENEIMLRIILPDGNQPKLEQINEITLNGIKQGKAKETANVLSRILEMFRNDYGAYNALYDLCCEQFEGYIPVLHKALEGLVRLSPTANAKSYYRRDQRQYAYMLAVLDALMIANKTTAEVINYDFTENTGEYFLKNASSETGLPYSEAMAISNVKIETSSKLDNRSPEEVMRMSQGYLSCITGNWVAMIRIFQKNPADVQQEFDFQIDEVENIGFVRSVFRVLLDTETGQRMKLINDLTEKIKHNQERKSQIKFIKSFFQKGYFEELENQIDLEPFEAILLNPFEDYSLATYLKKKYIDAAIRNKSEHLYPLSLIIGAMIFHPGFQLDLVKKAGQLFAESDDIQACSLYHSLLDLYTSLHLMHRDFRLGTAKKGAEKKIKEQYEAGYRLTAVFSRDRKVIAKVSDHNFHVWSCINLVLVLLYSDRGDEILRLASCFSKENAFLAEAILRGFDPSVNDRDKLDIVDMLHDDVAKAYYCYVIKHPYNPSKDILKSYALNDLDVMKEMNARYISLANQLGERKDSSVNGRSLSHTLLLGSRKPDSRVFAQKDPQMWNTFNEAAEPDDGKLTIEEPFFIEGIEPIYKQADLSSLISEHRSIPNLTPRIQEKIDLSRRIYQYCLGNDDTQLQCRDAMLLFGSDYYQYSWSVVRDWKTANRAALDLARILKNSGQRDGYGYEQARNLMNDALFRLLNSYDTLEDLLTQYSECRTVFHYMRSLLNDPLIMANVGQIYSVLDSLKDCYASAVRENPEKLREELSKSYRQLELIETNRWMELKNRIQKLINDEINELDQRPVLQIEVLNRGIQRNYGSLFGQVRNIGQITANSIVLQANYSDNGRSASYILERLCPGNQAVFELDYSCDASLEEVEYYLNTTFSYAEKTHTGLALKGVLKLGKVDEPQYPANLLCKDANGVIFDVNEETGEVFSSEFVGRKKETAELRALVDGDLFQGYKSALIYGIRRTGKTTLLNYFEAYIKVKCPGVLRVRIDCQSLPENVSDCIQHVFIDRVCDSVEIQVPELKTADSWTEFKNTWYSDVFCVDEHIEKLSLFYLSLRKLLDGRGVYVIVDEIDRLFERIEKRLSKNIKALEGLFGAISAMLTNPECQFAVHFVICGSNWLIRYNLQVDNNNQFFQRFGKQIIEIGKLPRDDMKEILCKPYKSYPQLTITEEAIDWIWNYTGGLVWHTKLLGEDAIKRAKDDWRCAVYPSDVQLSLPKVITEHWCKQFYEGCETGATYQVVDAMQSLATQKDGYVHAERLCELLGWSILDLQKAMIVLEELKVISSHPLDPQLYRFEQDIYRRFFRIMPSKYERLPEEPEIFRKKQQIVSASQINDLSAWDPFAEID